MKSSSAFNRKLQALQFQIQEKITSSDDEISRLTQRLVNLKILISEAQAHLENINHSIIQAKTSHDGTILKKCATLNAKMSLIKAQYYKEIQKLKQKQAQELENIHDSFSSSLESINQKSNNLISSQLSQISEQISLTKKDLSKTKLHLQNVMNYTEIEKDEDPKSENNNPQVQELQTTIKLCQQERIENLREARDHLSEVVDQLNQNEQEYSLQIKKLEDQITELDKKYQSTIISLNNDQSLEINVLKKTLNDIENKSETLDRTLEKLDKSRRHEITQVKNDLNQIKKQSKSSSLSISPSDESSQLEELQNQRQAIINSIKTKEIRLEKERKKNDELKRDIAKIRHQIKYAYLLN